MTVCRKRKLMMKRQLSLFSIVIALLICISCSESTNPTPVLDSMSPDQYVKGMPSFTLTVKGEDFVKGAQIVFNGIAKDTKYCGSKELTTEITKEEIDKAMTSSSGKLFASTEINIPVYIKNPSSGGTVSETIQFIVRNKYTFTEPEQITDLKETATKMKIYYDQYGTIHALWQVADPDNYWLLYTQSRSNGENFSSVSYLESSTISETTPKAIEITSVENENTFVGWNYYLSNTDGSSDKFWIDLSTDNGTSFSTSYFGAETTDTIGDIAIGAYGSGNVFCSWLNINTDKIGTVLFRKRLESDTDFTNLLQLNLTPAYSGIGMNVDDDGKITVSWIASDISTGKDAVCYAVSSDYGKSFGEQRTLTVASSPQENLRTLSSIIGNDGTIYRAWWRYDATFTGTFYADIAAGNETDGLFKTTTIAEFSGLDTSSLPEIQLAIDKAHNVYAAIVTADNIVHFYRSTDACASFQEIAEPQNWNAANSAAFTVTDEGELLLIFPKQISYEEEDDEGNTVTKTAIEVFFVKSNE